jgi:16S rRNA (uracil1498-N3)-methyltransferase
VSPDRIDGKDVIFDANDSHHIHTVLKMRAGDKCIVLDGAGRACESVLVDVAKGRVTARVQRDTKPQTEPSVHIDVAQALPKTLDRLEQVLQHGTEIGVGGFIIFSCERSRPEAEKFDKKLPRWREIVKTAAEQSERAKLPTVEGIIPLSDVLKLASDYDLALFAYEREEIVTLRSKLEGSDAKRILIVIGPEGGFSDGEVANARAAGQPTVTLGPRILRTETAALMMVSQIIYSLGG